MGKYNVFSIFLDGKWVDNCYRSVDKSVEADSLEEAAIKTRNRETLFGLEEIHIYNGNLAIIPIHFNDFQTKYFLIKADIQDGEETEAEWCPNCGAEVELPRIFKPHTCPNCQERILPCAQCEEQNCIECPLN